MTTTLALAARLRELDDAALVGALHRRAYRRTGVSDFFDLADALLDADSVQRALVPLDRPRLATVVVLGRAPEPLSAEEVAARLAAEPATAGIAVDAVTAALEDLTGLLLAQPADGDPRRFAVYDAVTAQLDAWADLGIPSPDELLRTAPPPALAPVPDTERRFTDRLAAERAFEAVTAVSELLAELAREGARRLQKGGVALPAIKRLAEAMSVDAELVPVALSAAERAGLAAVDDGMWLPTDRAASWSHAPTPERWRALATAWLEALPDDVRSLLALRSRAAWGESLREHVAWLHPAAVEEAQERVDAHTRLADWLGITAHQAPSTAGAALVEQGPEAAAAAMAELFPAEVDRVYLQHDLTIVSPGPLAPEVETRLRGIADLESRALASTFRLSAASVDRALTAGETADGIREFLSSISLTGLPQPLDYLVTDAAERHGRVRVREAEGTDGARSAVRSADGTLLRTIQVDQALGSLRLSQGGDGELLSRFPRDVVFWALSDARYPVVAEDAGGREVILRRQRVARARAEAVEDRDAELVARLRTAEEEAGDDTGERWLARQLDLAVRSRSPIVIEVAMPDGRVVDYLLEPTGVGGGRLRGRDRAADIERTLPLSSVRGVRPAP
ncbi:helicase-associated domain-containing protein [Leifsonia sp. C5G2]|uniref:helicase-associated domain-containing protein n=1 Tax=Leifsonia sp. C5G2 TaxID=2735269 RepID=UPI0015853AB6|nr:helicase-associated domain-containing protein [Leifsonia sp. C5G2]NUU07657.1 helicase-associated domain-containing protein [Leifsonia sp. C5G2]